MKLKQAIKILEEQKQKVLSSEPPNNRQLILQTGSYIKDFFGINSAEFNFINRFDFNVDFADSVPDKNKHFILEHKAKDFVLFLNNCKLTLKNKGLFKEPKKNLLSDKSNFEIIGIIFGICVFVFWIGYWTKKFEVFSVASKSEKSISIPAINSTENVTDEKGKITESENSKNE
tara:strand:- start:104 stop:625 length:522 start_codon:yes stop_codon:yes gene_type:complete